MSLTTLSDSDDNFIILLRVKIKCFGDGSLIKSLKNMTQSMKEEGQDAEGRLQKMNKMSL